MIENKYVEGEIPKVVTFESNRGIQQVKTLYENKRYPIFTISEQDILIEQGKFRGFTLAKDSVTKFSMHYHKNSLFILRVSFMTGIETKKEETHYDFACFTEIDVPIALIWLKEIQRCHKIQYEIGKEVAHVTQKTIPTIEQRIMFQLSSLISRELSEQFITNCKEFYSIRPTDSYQCVAVFQQMLDDEYLKVTDRVMNALCKKPIVLFKRYYLMMDKENDIIFTKLEIRKAKEVGWLIHPRTGGRVKNFQKKLYPVWKGTDLLATWVKIDEQIGTK